MKMRRLPAFAIMVSFDDAIIQDTIAGVVIGSEKYASDKMEELKHDVKDIGRWYLKSVTCYMSDFESKLP